MKNKNTIIDLNEPSFDELITLRKAYMIMESFLKDYVKRGDTPVSELLFNYAGITAIGTSADPAALSDFLAHADLFKNT